MTFIAYSVAFDSASNTFVDLSLKNTGVSHKSRGMFSPIYAVAEGTSTTVCSLAFKAVLYREI